MNEWTEPRLCSTNWSFDQAKAAAEAPGVINGRVASKEPAGWELHPALHDPVADCLMERMRFPDVRELLCPRCGSEDMASFSTSATCLQPCSWRGETASAEEAGRTFYRATISDDTIQVGPARVMVPEGVACVARTAQQAADKLKELIQRIAVTVYVERKNSDDYGMREVASMMERSDGEPD